MEQALTFSEPNVSMVVRTLILAGYTITNTKRQPTHIELECSATLLGAKVPVLIALTGSDELPEQICSQLKEVARRSGRTLVIVAAVGGDGQYAWADFMQKFGGVVPSWRALSNDYAAQLSSAGSNQLPEGLEGEPWRLFEQLAADGLEFCFGRRVRRLGAARRGQRVSDMITQIPEEDVIVVDAKATATSFNAAMHELRPLAEYVKNQKIRQKGSYNVFGALVVSKAFDQDQDGLIQISGEFLAEAGAPVAFLQLDDLVHFVGTFRDSPSLRPAMKWRRILSGGLVLRGKFASELAAINAERY